MAKSSGGFLRVQTLIDKGYDPLAYGLFCMSAHYRAKLNFSWDGLDGAAKSLSRLRTLSYEWGEPGIIDEHYADQFTAQINDDLNMPPRCSCDLGTRQKRTSRRRPKKPPYCSSTECWA